MDAEGGLQTGPNLTEGVTPAGSFVHLCSLEHRSWNKQLAREGTRSTANTNVL